MEVGVTGHGALSPPQVLDLSHNELSFVPPDLPEALEELHLQGNRIGSVGPEAFLGTPRLRALFLRCRSGRGGLLATVASPAPALMAASLCRANRLHMTSISAEAFLGLPHLRVVDTADNLEQVLVRLSSTVPHRPRQGPEPRGT